LGKKDTLALLNAVGYYPNAPLTIVIRAVTGKEFNKPEQYYKSKDVCIRGKIELSKDKPQIIIETKKQIVEK
jgi:hypothetical protein